VDIRLPLARGINNKKNLTMQGYLAITALVLHTILILIVIVPSFTGSVREIGELTAIASLTVCSHVVLDHSRSLRHQLIGAWLSKPT